MHFQYSYIYTKNKTFIFVLHTQIHNSKRPSLYVNIAKVYLLIFIKCSHSHLGFEAQNKAIAYI